MARIARRVRSEQLHVRLTADESATLQQLCNASNLNRGELVRRMLVASGKRQVERAIASETEAMASDVAAIARRVDAVHARLGGIEHDMLARLDTSVGLERDILDAFATLSELAAKTMFAAEALVACAADDRVRQYAKSRFDQYREQRSAQTPERRG